MQCVVAVRHKYFRKGFNPESEVLKEYENQILGVKGKVYEKKPAKVELKPGKNYHWCSCGYGHTQVSSSFTTEVSLIFGGINFLDFVNTQLQQYVNLICRQYSTDESIGQGL